MDNKKIVIGAPKWMVTFGDMMSLLLCFFVLLLSFSEIDRQKYKQVAGSMEKAFGVQRQEKVMDIPKGMEMVAKDFDQDILATRIKEELGREIEEMISSRLADLEDKVDLEVGDDKLIIRLMGESTFDSGKAEIKSEMKPLLDRIIAILQDSKGDIVVAGHTDDVPIHGGPFSSNLRLSSARAAAVAEYILAGGRIDPGRLSTMGFGEYRPLDDNSTASGRERNRRVEIVLSSIPSRKP